MKINLQILNILLAKKCISGYELMRHAGLQEHTYARIKNGFENLRPTTVGKIAKALNVDVEEILQE
ncbi:XRE family transcriptional regulator [Fusobacterium necrophorum]|uniref:XRE family transcriptional regulator n=1 Tax=Fusobacterium necrophorum TaxID=859 RepID=A0A4Q2L0G3_9FUSO|nr:helix-turn-helix transcriptional regulator [Fusobacterium necrophorum]RXZ69823.1 XRE family transcriptional regulator [Fusobacterium necrophorum]